jgi:hypothetical protein
MKSVRRTSALVRITDSSRTSREVRKAAAMKLAQYLRSLPFSHRRTKLSSHSLLTMRPASIALLSAFAVCYPHDKKETAMKLATILLASAFALSGTFAFAQAGGANGTAGGPTTLSGTGTSAMGGDTAGAVTAAVPPQVAP